MLFNVWCSRRTLDLSSTAARRAVRYRQFLGNAAPAAVSILALLPLSLTHTLRSTRNSDSVTASTSVPARRFRSHAHSVRTHPPLPTASSLGRPRLTQHHLASGRACTLRCPHPRPHDDNDGPRAPLAIATPTRHRFARVLLPRNALGRTWRPRRHATRAHLRPRRSPASQVRVCT